MYRKFWTSLETKRVALTAHEFCQTVPQIHLPTKNALIFDSYLDIGHFLETVQTEVVDMNEMQILWKRNSHPCNHRVRLQLIVVAGMFRAAVFDFEPRIYAHFMVYAQAWQARNGVTL